MHTCSWCYDCAELGSTCLGYPFFSLGPSVQSQVKVTTSAAQSLDDVEMVDYLDRGRCDSTNLVLDLSFVHGRHGASRANPQA